MSLFFRRPDERRAITRADWARGADLSPVTKAGVNVTFDSALALDAVAAVVGLLSDVVYMLPVDAFREQRGGVPQAISAPPLIAQPSMQVAPRDWRVQALVSWLLYGNVWGLVLSRSALGMPQTVEILDPSTVDAVDVGVGRPLEVRVDGRDVSADRLLHAPGRWLRPGSQLGIAPLERFRETIGLAQAARDFGASWFGQGAHPSAILTMPDDPGPKNAKAYKQRFMDSVRGKREPAVLFGGVQYQQVQSNPEQSQLVDVSDRAVVAVARSFGVMPEMVAAAVSGSSVTYANREQRAIDFLTFSADPWLVRFEDLWFRNMPRPKFAKFNRGALLRTDTKTRYEVHEVAIRSGMASPNERRLLEDLPPYDGGDEFTNAGATLGGADDDDE